ncbi:unnamed protein product [Paramecium sonneborni]|uniref:Uncharacterized protein n=1 Tax=Paramecium sonneborni TaxID=65129 RepID=A0A8S1RP26_9CILI|nr:unnamed protein product [Paramecium sonneborni]
MVFYDFYINFNHNCSILLFFNLCYMNSELAQIFIFYIFCFSQFHYVYFQDVNSIKINFQNRGCCLICKDQAVINQCLNNKISKIQNKEKFDKKANKEKQKQEQEKEKVEIKQESNKTKQESSKGNQKQNTKPVQQQLKNEEQIIQQQQAVIDKQIVQIDASKEQNKRKDFLSHLPIFQDYSSESIKSVKQIDPYTLHHSFIELCIQYQNGQCIGSTHRCVEFLNALKQFRKDYKLSRQSNYFAIAFLDELKKIFNLMKNFLSNSK